MAAAADQEVQVASFVGLQHMRREHRAVATLVVRGRRRPRAPPSRHLRIVDEQVEAPRGAVLKRSAAEARLLDHVGPAVVFKDHHDLVARIDAPDLEVTPDSVLVLQEAGPIGAPGMPEWGMLPIPKKLLEAGVRDMVRISDARMSGTSYGTCVLHVCPESHVGGPLGLVRDGDLIRLDAAARRRAWTAPPAHYERGYGAMFSAHVLQADEGCDFDYLARPGVNPEPEIH